MRGGIAGKRLGNGANAARPSVLQKTPFRAKPVARVARIAEIALQNQRRRRLRFRRDRPGCSCRPSRRDKRARAAPADAFRQSARQREQASRRSAASSSVHGPHPPRSRPTTSAVKLRRAIEAACELVFRDRTGFSRMPSGNPGIARISGRSSMKTSQPRSAARATLSSLVSSKNTLAGSICAAPSPTSPRRPESRARPRACRASAPGSDGGSCG